MVKRLNLIGAVTAQVIYVSSIITFLSRMIFKITPGHWVGTPLLLMVVPLGYLLIKAAEENRPFIYYLQTGLMLFFILFLFLVDFIFQFDFRQTNWMVISFVVLYFAAMGGMIGVASSAGRGWMISSVLLFFITAILAFVQRSVTGY